MLGKVDWEALVSLSSLGHHSAPTTAILSLGHGGHAYSWSGHQGTCAPAHLLCLFPGLGGTPVISVSFRTPTPTVSGQFFNGS